MKKDYFGQEGDRQEIPMLVETFGIGEGKVEITFYGTGSFKQTNEGMHLDDLMEMVEINKERNIYFVRCVEYERGKSGGFELIVWHFEDYMMSAYTYRISPADGRRLLEKYSDSESLKNAFSERDARRFLQYCADNGIFVEYTKYWL